MYGSIFVFMHYLLWGEGRCLEGIPSGPPSGLSLRLSLGLHLCLSLGSSVEG